MNELKPCPFCGGTPILELFNDGFFDYARIRCCRVMFDWCGDETGEQAIAAWNRRATPDGCENELIVRCKDCKHYDTIGCSKSFGWCENIDRGTSDNFYCANGKQLNKESEDN
jgi:Lar family restriction alleviation protein